MGGGVENGRWRVQNHPELEIKFKANLSIIEEFCFKFKKRKNGIRARVITQW